MQEYKLKVLSIETEKKDDYGYSVILKCSGSRHLSGRTLIEPNKLIGEQLIFHGKVTGHNEYFEEIIKFNMYEFKDSYNFLLNKILKFPKGALKHLYENYTSENIYQMLNEKSTEFLEIKGVGKLTLKNIFEQWDYNKTHFEMVTLLAQFNFSHNMIQTIKKRYKNNMEVIKDVISNHPYDLGDIEGIDFKQLDRVLLKAGHNPWDYQRLIRGVSYAGVKLMEGRGSTVVSYDNLYKSSKYYLDTNETAINFKLHVIDFAKIIHPQNTSDFKHVENKLTLSHFYKMEKYIFETLTYEANKKDEEYLNDVDLDEWIEKKEDHYSIKISDKQRDIIKLANQRTNVFSLAGYAGSGKTFIAKLVMNLYEEFGSTIHCCALSGVAASRIKIVSGYNAKTIHSLLGFGQDGWAYNKENPLQYDLIVLDESGMVSIEMFYQLLQAIDFGRTKLFIIGDPAQLPPVGAGDPFKDLVNNNLINLVELDKVFRQAGDSIINIVAQDIRKHTFSNEYHNSNSDGFYTQWFNKNESENDDIISFIKKKSKSIMNGECFEEANLLNFQLITPVKDGVLGVRNLNNILQSIINKKTKSLTVGGISFKESDKVIHLENQKMNLYNIDYSKSEDEDKIYNGQIGIIKKIDNKLRLAFVYYPFEDQLVAYDIASLMNNVLGLAYALTAHKVQGNEFKNVITVMSSEMERYLNSNYVYSAFTRAKENLFVVGNKESILYGLEKTEQAKRNTIIQTMSSNIN